MAWTEKKGKGKQDEANRVKECTQVARQRPLAQNGVGGGRRPENQGSAPLSPTASPLPGPKRPSLPPWSSWQMELLIAFEVTGVTLHTRELQAQLQLST